MKSVTKILKILHWIGLCLLLCGAGLYLGAELATRISGMVLIAVLIGLGLVMMAPYPVMLFIEWARRQSGDRG